MDRLINIRAGSRKPQQQPNNLLPRRQAALAIVLLLSIVSCEKQPAKVPSPPFDEIFELVEVIELGEDPSDSIADVGEFFERRDGGFVIADRLLPRVRTYREDGSLEAAFGRFGDGPWEFRRIRSVAELADGRIVVTGAQSGALTFLAPDLTPRSMLLVENYVPGTVLPIGPEHRVRRDWTGHVRSRHARSLSSAGRQHGNLEQLETRWLPASRIGMAWDVLTLRLVGTPCT